LCAEAPRLRLDAFSTPRLRLAAVSTGQRRANTPYDLGRAVSGQDPYDDPSKSLKGFQSPNVPGVLPSVAAMLLAVILDGDFDVLPTHIEVRDCVAKLVAYRNLSLRAR
jgi:hypothetical protein